MWNKATQQAECKRIWLALGRHNMLARYNMCYVTLFCPKSLRFFSLSPPVAMNLLKKEIEVKLKLESF